MKEHSIKVELHTKLGRNTTEMVGEGVEVYPAALQFLSNVIQELKEEHNANEASEFMGGAVTIDGEQYPMLDGYSALKDRYDRLMAYIKKKSNKDTQNSVKDYNKFEYAFKLDNGVELQVSGKVKEGTLYDINKALVLTAGEDTVMFPVQWVSSEALNNLAREMQEFFMDVKMASLLAMKHK